MSLRVLLVDDEPLALERLRFAFKQIPAADVVGSAADGAEALEKIRELHPDLVILDVQMPGLTGMGVAAALAEERRPELIFVTAFDHYASEAFDVEATDYLLKPVRFERLRLAVDRARRRRALREASDRNAELEDVVDALRKEVRQAAPATRRYDAELWAPGRQGQVRISLQQIDWIEAARDYVLLHTPVRSHILRTTMAALEERLDPAILLRVHRSAFVRLGAVAAVERPGKAQVSVRLADGTQVQVGPNYVDQLIKSLGLPD